MAEWSQWGSSIAAGCFPVSRIAILCLPQQFKAMQSTATLRSSLGKTATMDWLIWRLIVMWQSIMRWLSTSTSCLKRNADWILSCNCARRNFVKWKFGYWHPLICFSESTYVFYWLTCSISIINDILKQASNQLGTPGGRRVFWDGPKCFKLCPIILNYVQNIFPGGRKIL